MIETRHLHYAIALAEHRSFSQAAAAVGISQPSLTRGIQSLEQYLGLELFDRSKRVIEPTEAGRLFLEGAREVVHRGQELERAIGEIRVNNQPELVVSAGAYATEVVATASARLLRSDPRIRLRLRIADWQAAITDVRARDAHLCVAEASTFADDAELTVRPLRRHQGYVVVRAEHPLAARGGTVALADAFKYPMVAMTRFPPRILGQLHGARRRCGNAVPSFPAISCEHLSVARRILAESDCFALLTLPQVEAELRSARLVALRCDEPWMHTAYGVMHLRSRRLEPEAERLIRLLELADEEVAASEEQLASELLPRPQRRPAAGSRRIQVGQ